MNKKILFLAFASAALFFGCSADRMIGEALQLKYCYVCPGCSPLLGSGQWMCQVINNNVMTEEFCHSSELNGEIVDSCPTPSSSSGGPGSSSSGPSSSSGN